MVVMIEMIMVMMGVIMTIMMMRVIMMIVVMMMMMMMMIVVMIRMMMIMVMIIVVMIIHFLSLLTSPLVKELIDASIRHLIVGDGQSTIKHWRKPLPVDIGHSWSTMNIAYYSQDDVDDDDACL